MEDLIIIMLAMILVYQITKPKFKKQIMKLKLVRVDVRDVVVTAESESCHGISYKTEIYTGEMPGMPDDIQLFKEVES